MPEVSVVVELRVAVEDDVDSVALERKICAEGRRAARELYAKVLVALDERATANSGGARQRLEPRWVATLAGRIRLHRYRVKDQDGTHHPLQLHQLPGRLPRGVASLRDRTPGSVRAGSMPAALA